MLHHQPFTFSRGSGEKLRYIPCSVRQRAAYKNGARRLIFNMRPSEAYKTEKALHGGSQLFPFTTSSSYIGSWKDDKKHGFGVVTFVNGSRYEGEFECGQRHGKGTFWVKENHQQRKLYAGEWRCDKPDGCGIYYSKNGNKYEGQWLDGRRHGKGSMRYANGDLYEGEWQEGERSGLGMLHLANGDRYEGGWMYNVKEGPGLFFYTSTGKAYEGEWVDGSPKCGELRDQTVDELASATSQIGSSPRFSQSFQAGNEGYILPELGLVHPRLIVGQEIARLRQERVRRYEGVPETDVGELPASAGSEDRPSSRPGAANFTDQELNLLAEAFSTYSKERVATGAMAVESKQPRQERQEQETEAGEQVDRRVFCSDVLPLLETLGIPVDPSWLSSFLTSIQAEAEIALSYADFVDLVAITLQSGLLPEAEDSEGPEENREVGAVPGA